MSLGLDNIVMVKGHGVNLAAIGSILTAALDSYSPTHIKLVYSSASFQLAVFFTSPQKVDAVAFLEDVRETLVIHHSPPLGDVVSFARQLTEMPIDKGGGIDVPALHSIAEEYWAAERSSHQNGHATSTHPRLTRPISSPHQPTKDRLGDLGNTLSLTTLDDLKSPRDQVRKVPPAHSVAILLKLASAKKFRPHISEVTAKVREATNDEPR